jgi:hypothetical protein
MAVAMLVDNPEGSQETYDWVSKRLGLERPAGGIFHLAGPSPNGGWRVIEVWESEEDAKRFVERLRPAFEAVGAPCARALASAQLHGVGREEEASDGYAGWAGEASAVPNAGEPRRPARWRLRQVVIGRAENGALLPLRVVTGLEDPHHWFQALSIPAARDVQTARAPSRT